MNQLLAALWDYVQSRAFFEDLLIAAAVLGAFVVGAFVLRFLLGFLVARRPESKDNLILGLLRSLKTPVFYLVFLLGAGLAVAIVLRRSPIDVTIILDLAYAAVVMSGFVLVAYVARAVALWWLQHDAEGKKTLLGAVLASLVQPGFYLLLALGGRVGAAMLIEGWRRVGVLAHETFYVATLLVGAYAAYRVGDALLTWYQKGRRAVADVRLGEHIALLARKGLKLVLFAWAAATIVEHFGYDIKTVLATVGIASLALGLAAKETVENMISGVTIMLDRPFRVGDRIELPSGKVGDVYEIGIRSCKILTQDQMMVVVPNTLIATNSIVNLSYPNPIIRLETHVGVAYGTDPALVKETLERIGREARDVLRTPPPAAYFYEHGDSALKFVLMTFISSYRDHWELRDRLCTAITLEFQRLGINIPFPMRTLILQQPKGGGLPAPAVPEPGLPPPGPGKA